MFGQRSAACNNTVIKAGGIVICAGKIIVCIIDINKLYLVNLVGIVI